MEHLHVYNMIFCKSFIQNSRTAKNINMSKCKSDNELEILEKLVKKKQILLHSYLGCSSCFNKAKNDSKTKKTPSSVP